jgi:opacity protein-like surface antigen
MKKHKFISALCGAALLACCVPVKAMDLSGTSIKFEAGPNWVQNLGIQDADGHKAIFDIGLRTSVAFTHDLTEHVGLSLETGFLWNTVRRVGVEPPPPPPPPPPAGSTNYYLNGKADLYQVPLLLNVAYKINKGRWTHYVGVGAGGMAGILYARFPTVDVNDYDFTFAFQGFAGVKYQITDKMHIGLSYKFLGTLEHDWQGNGLAVRTGGLRNHSVVAALVLKL